VLAALLDSMHLIVRAVDAPFEPEAGAYAQEGHGHGHGHAHGPLVNQDFGAAAASHDGHSHH
jgi:urease accessory protein